MVANEFRWFAKIKIVSFDIRGSLLKKIQLIESETKYDENGFSYYSEI